MDSDNSITSTDQPTCFQLPTESVLFESSRHRFNWSTDLPTDIRKNSRKSTIYQLMLDSRVELKNGGNKISSTKSASASASCAKKRKKQQGSSLTENGLPDMANRSPFVTGYELAINSFQPHKLRAYFEEHADRAMSLQIDMSALSPDASLMLYREIKGLECVLSYLNVYNQVIPDAVQLYWQKNVRRFDDGSKEIETECRMIGTKFFDITVIEDSSYQQEQQILEEAIFGLTSLCKSHIESGGGKAKGKATSATTFAFDASSASSSPSPLPQSRGDVARSDKNIRSLDRINILIADDKVEFLVGDRLPTPQVVDLQGKFMWLVNSHKKITRLKFILMKKEMMDVSNPTPSSNPSDSNSQSHTGSIDVSGSTSGSGNTTSVSSDITNT